ncbi:serine hydrolase domain-containing protein [Mycolicibacterium setense]
MHPTTGPNVERRTHAKVGMKLNQGRLAELKQRAQQDIDDGHVPACQYALAGDGEVLAYETLGAAADDARFAMWSATKPVFASVVWQLIGEGKLSPAEPVVALWPEFGINAKAVVTLDHLLLFTAGFPQATLDLATVADRAARVRQMQAWTLDWEPGSAFQYHGFSAHYVMAELVARATGTDHRAALRERVLEPLGLDRLELGVARDRQRDIQNMVETGNRAPISEILRALGLTEIPAGWEAMMAPAAGAAGSSPTVGLQSLERPEVRDAGIPGAGAVSDAASVALFYQALLHNQAGVWAPEILHDVTMNVRNNYPGADLGVLAMRTRGLELQGNDRTAIFRCSGGAASPRTFGHGGAAGQIAWADPVTGLSFAYLTNGADRNVVRQARRTQQLNAAAAACVE